MGYTRATRREHGLVHITINEYGDTWEAACDVPPYMNSRNAIRGRKTIGPRQADVPTCLACIESDRTWWARNALGSRR